MKKINITGITTTNLKSTCSLKQCHCCYLFYTSHTLVISLSLESHTSPADVVLRAPLFLIAKGIRLESHTSPARRTTRSAVPHC
jgi:hypothetical protein